MSTTQELENEVTVGTSHTPSIALPSRRVLMLALLAGLFVSWWGSFHEAACGCIKLHSMMSLFYLKLGCYAFSLGSAAAGLAWALTSRRSGDKSLKMEIASPFLRFNNVSLPWLACATVGFFAAGFYISLTAEALPLAIVFQLLLHISCTTIVIVGVMAFSDLPLSDIAAGALVVLVCYMLFNNVLLPSTVGAIGSFKLVAAIQAFVLVAIAALASAILRDPQNQLLFARGWENANHRIEKPVGEQSGNRIRVAPQPIFNLFVYSLVFGLMHVEASMRFADYGNRNVPYVVGMLVAVVVFYLTFMRKASTMRIWPKVQSGVFTLTISAFMLLPVISQNSSIVPVALIEAAYFYYDALFVLACLVISRESALSLRTVLGIGIAVKGVGYFLGVIACHLQLDFFGESVIERPVAILVVFLLLASVTLWMGDTIVAKKLWGMRIERAPRHGVDEALIQERCDKLAQAYHLTPRESEVCAKLAEGTEIEDAAAALYISVQTLRTHIRNVYAKTNVHARRDLIRLLESMDER